MQELKPCPNCHSGSYHIYGLADEVECNDCGELRTIAEWEADTAREKALRAELSVLETELCGNGKILERMDKAGSWGVMVDAAKLQEMEARLSQLENALQSAESALSLVKHRKDDGLVDEALSKVVKALQAAGEVAK